MKKRRVLNRFFVAGLAGGLLILISLYKIPHFLNVKKLKSLGYDEASIASIYDKKVTSAILKNEYYSDYLKTEVQKDTFNKDYLHLYAVSDHLDDQAFKLYDRLITLKGYTKDEMTKLYDNLSYFEISPLLVFDKLMNIDAYIADCKTHGDNDSNKFILTNDYLNAYTNTSAVINPESDEAFVSMKFDLKSYAPDKLVPMSNQIATDGLFLQSRALAAFESLCDAIRHESSGIYAVSAYRSFNEQAKIYNSYDNAKEADENVTRPGFLDNQLGMSVMVVSSENESLANFKDTESYKWLQANAHKYGFIFRYPENKKSITGQDGMPYYLRYVGIDLAKKIHDSQLTFDEYYMLEMYQINPDKKDAR